MLARKTLLDGVVLAGPYKLPLRQPHERLQLAVLRQYKDLLVQTKFLFDENARCRCRGTIADLEQEICRGKNTAEVPG